MKQQEQSQSVASVILNISTIIVSSAFGMWYNKRMKLEEKINIAKERAERLEDFEKQENLKAEYRNSCMDDRLKEFEMQERIRVKVRVENNA